MKRSIKDVNLPEVLTFSISMTVSLVGIQHSSAVMLIPDETEDQNISSWLTGLPLDDANFGATVALFDRDLAIGAPSQVFLDPDSDQFPYGAVFTLDEGKIEWDDGDILTDNDAVDDLCIYQSPGWKLGDSVAISATHLAVGAPNKSIEANDTCNFNAGSVYVYQSLPNPIFPSWLETDYLESPSIDAGDLFGDAVALTSQLLMVGASGREDGSDIPGNVYIYDLISLSDPPVVINSGINEKDAFGAAIAIDKSTESLMVVGSPFANKPETDACGTGGYQEGAVYVYRLDNGTWTPDGVLWPDDDGVWGGFGSAVACGTDIAGVERIVVGEPVRCISGGPCASCFESFLGKVYVFRFDPVGEKWDIEATFVSPAIEPENDDFGHSVDIDGWDIVIGARREEDPSAEPVHGAAYRASYSFCNDNWSINTRFVSGTIQSKWLGSSVVIEDGWIIAGAAHTGVDSNYGAAYGYEYTPTLMLQCNGDFDGDGEVGILDLLALLANWGEPHVVVGDMDCDGDVDVLDLLELINVWGSCSGGGGDPLPSEVQDCLDLYPVGSVELKDCLEAIQ